MDRIPQTPRHSGLAQTRREHQSQRPGHLLSLLQQRWMRLRDRNRSLYSSSAGGAATRRSASIFKARRCQAVFQAWTSVSSPSQASM